MHIVTMAVQPVYAIKETKRELVKKARLFTGTTGVHVLHMMFADDMVLVQRWKEQCSTMNDALTNGIVK